MKFILLAILLVGCATKKTDTPAPVVVEEIKTEEEVKVKRKIRLWATMYYAKVLNNDPSGIPLRKMNGDPLGPRLSRADWCRAAIEGTAIIDGVVYNYAGTNWRYFVKCSHRASGKVKWMRSGCKYGKGNRSNCLVPFRSLATDQTKYPYGTKIFIPEAKGTKITFEGETFEHDGVFYAHDVGGAIKGDHIDVYLGAVKDGLKGALAINPFPWIKSKSSDTFEAFIIE